MSIKKNIDYKKLYQMYVVETLSLKEIAVAFDTSVDVITRARKEYNFPDRNKKPRTKTKFISKEAIISALCINKHRLVKTATYLDISYNNFIMLCNQYNILLNTSRSSDINKDILYELYINKNLTISDIAKYFNVHNDTIAKYRDKYNLPRRNQGTINELVKYISKNDAELALSLNNNKITSAAKSVNMSYELFNAFCIEYNIKPLYTHHNISKDDLEKAILKFNNTGISLIAKELNVTPGWISDLVKIYNLPKINVLSNKTYNDENEKELIHMYKTTTNSIAEISRNINIPLSACYSIMLKHQISLSTNRSILHTGKSRSEDIFVDFISSCTDEAVIASSSVLGRKSIDCYIPSLKIGFEYNGLYWHSLAFREKDYHLNKYLKAEENGIRLINIFEDEWLENSDKIKQKINSLLNPVRYECYAHEIDKSTVESFGMTCSYDDNAASIYIGLFDSSNLIIDVAHCIFDSITNTVEILDYTNITDSFSVLLSSIIETLKPAQVIMTLDCCWYNTNNNFLLDNGFLFVERINPTEYEMKNFKSREKTGTYTTESFDNKVYSKIYDCGKISYKLEVTYGAIMA